MLSTNILYYWHLRLCSFMQTQADLHLALVPLVDTVTRSMEPVQLRINQVPQPMYPAAHLTAQVQLRSITIAIGPDLIRYQRKSINI